ncbi:response regulator [Kribbella sp. NPDC004536]|uniref:response regulator n=1 Tax=Kribbella sp. NPDC004536 TaxID=3364106 RepID=UPI00369BA9F0
MSADPEVTGRTDRRLRSVALGVLGLALLGTVVTVVAAAASGLSWSRLVDLFVVTNTLIGLCLALAGRPIADRHPRNLVGWSLLVGGVCYGSTALGTGVIAWLGEPRAFWRGIATVTNGGWTWTLATLLPVSLVLFPDGRLPSRRWRWVVAMLIVTGVSWTAAGVLDPNGGMTAELGVPGYPAWSGFQQIVWLEDVSAAGYLSAFAAVVVRYRRGSEQVRRQVLWLLLATILMVGCFAVATAAGSESLLFGVLPILLVPAAVAIAILRYQLLDIRLVVSRSVLVIALAFNPVRVWLQRFIQRAFYGARQDPVRAMVEVGARLGTAAGSGLDGVLAALCGVMRFPAAAVLVDRSRVSAYGELPAARHAIVLSSGAERLGELVVGLRSGEQRLDPADERVLTLLAAPLAVAVQARRLADQLRDSRERVITGREEERRRLRRDLHDGLGPVLTAVVLNAEAALRLLETDRGRSSVLLASLRDLTIGAVEEIRRLVDQLRPAALDGLGLLGALREYAVTAGRRSDGGALGITVDAPAELGELPAAVEVATYRIVTEALTNVIRHSSATTAGVRLAVEHGRLRLEVRDNGLNDGPQWQPGCRAHVDHRAGGRTRWRVRHPVRPDRVHGQRRPAVGTRRTPAAAMTLRIVVADDHGIVRESLGALLSAHQGYELIGTAANGEQAVRAAVTLHPDVLVMDIQMPGLSGIDATREIGRVAPGFAVLMLTMFDDESVFAAMRAGAQGHVLKGAAPDNVIRATAAVAAGEAIFGPGSLAGRWRTCPGRAPTSLRFPS